MFRTSVCPFSGVQVVYYCTPEDGHIDVRNM